MTSSVLSLNNTLSCNLLAYALRKPVAAKGYPPRALLPAPAPTLGWVERIYPNRGSPPDSSELHTELPQQRGG